MADSYNVPHAVMDRIYETLKFYANRCSYEGERTGGVLAGCPRGPVPTPDQLVIHAQNALSAIDRDVLGRTGMETVPAPEASFIETFRRSPRRVVPPGHFWRGEPESNRHQCRNCGEHYDKHLHTDEASLCPTTNR